MQNSIPVFQLFLFRYSYTSLHNYDEFTMKWSLERCIALRAVKTHFKKPRFFIKPKKLGFLGFFIFKSEFLLLISYQIL